MKILVKDYIFNKTQKQITFSALDTIDLEQVLLITNVTSNIIIYNFADSLCGGTVLGNILTLDYDTTSMSDSDKLQIFIDVSETPLPVGASTKAYQEDMIELLFALLKTSTYSRDAGDRLRIIMDNNPMLYTYMRNSGTGMNGGTEGFYSPGSWNVVDAREQLMSINNSAVISAMQRWRVQ